MIETAAWVHAAATSDSTGGFLDVDWNSIALVCVVTLVATVGVVSLYSAGMRLLAIGSPVDGLAVDGPAAGSDAASANQSSANVSHRRPVIASIGGYACVGVGILAVLYGVYLVIPLFHSA